MRTIIDLLPEQVDFLSRLCEREEISRAEAIRRAIDHYSTTQKPTIQDEDVLGLWQRRVKDGLSYQRAKRDEWGDNT